MSTQAMMANWRQSRTFVDDHGFALGTQGRRRREQ
jgi:hypothetical protein